MSVYVHIRSCLILRVITLMSNPLALLDSLGPSTQCHKITLNDVLGVLGVEPQRKRSWKVIGVDEFVAVHNAAGVVHANGLSKRRGVWQRRNLGGQSSRRLAPFSGQLWRGRLAGGRTSWALLRTRRGFASSETGVADGDSSVKGK